MNDAADGDNVVSSYLDHDHPERIDICFLAGANFSAQDFRCSPSYGIVLANGCDGIQVRNDGGEAKVRETRMSHIVDENAWLGHRLEVKAIFSEHIPL